MATARVPRPFDATVYDEPVGLMERGLAGQFVLATLPSRVPFWLTSSDPPVMPPPPLKVLTPTTPNFPPPWAAFCGEEAPNAKLPLSVAAEKEPLCLPIMPAVKGPVVSKSITCPVDATPEEMLPSEKR